MLRTFRIGGIHPPENKLSAGKKITGLAIPKQVTAEPAYRGSCPGCGKEG